MKIHVEPGFVHTMREPRFFVMQLGEREWGYKDGFRYEVQLLNGAGQGAAVVLFTGEESRFHAGKFEVPEAVFRAAMRQERGKGAYVNSRGERMHPLGKEAPTTRGQGPGAS